MDGGTDGATDRWTVGRTNKVDSHITFPSASIIGKGWLKKLIAAFQIGNKFFIIE